MDHKILYLLVLGVCFFGGLCDDGGSKPHFHTKEEEAVKVLKEQESTIKKDSGLQSILEDETLGLSGRESKSRAMKSSSWDQDVFNVGELRKSAFKYGKYLLEKVVMTDFTKLVPGLSTFKTDVSSSSSSPSSSSPSFQKRSSSEGAEGEHGGESTFMGHSLLRWLMSLVQPEGETLAQFLRIYRVHVLYDLVFYFFKWMFFAYVALLIP